MFCNVNGIELFYELSGQGSPIILVHGNGEDHNIFDHLIDKLSSNHTVYAVDSRCHGKSTKNVDISYELMASDMISFIQKLSIKNPIFYGFSDGGIIGILIAIRKPMLLKKLIVSGANINPTGLKPLTRFSIWCKSLSGDPLNRIMLKEPKIETYELNKISVPTIILVGQHDLIRKKHTIMIAANIPHSTLEIIPKENHDSYIIHSDKLYNIIKKYL